MFRHDLIVSITGILDATPAQVWRGITDPEIIKLYLHGTETVTDWKVGSEIVFQGEYGEQTYRDHGVLQEVEPNHKIRYTYFSGFFGLPDLPENYMMVSQIIEDQGNGKTALTWHQTGYADAEAQAKAQSGMEGFMAIIKDAIEGNA